MHIPSLDAVISGDVAYNGIHLWLASTDHDKRMQWIASVEQIDQQPQRLAPRFRYHGELL